MKSNAMRLMFLINGLGTGGAERSLAEMLPFLAAGGVDPFVVCLFHRREGVEREVRQSGFDVRVLRPSGWFGRIAQVRGLISSIRPDLIHTSIFESDVTGRIAALNRTVVLSSLVNTSYSAIRLGDPNIRRWRLGAGRLVDSWTARTLAHHFHAITQTVKRAAVASLRIPEDRITVIERGRDPVRLGRPNPARRNAAREKLGLDKEDQIVINVGRQEFQKGQRHLVKAMALLVPDHPRLKLLIAGRRGNASAELAEAAERLLPSGAIRFLGHRADLPDIMASADIFAFPSLYEGLGGALLEAMALGLPIVSSDLPAIREVVEPGKNALLAPSASASGLAKALSDLLGNDNMRRRFGEHGRRVFEERFTVGRTAEKMLELYQGLVAGSHLGSKDRSNLLSSVKS
jgi:glycosyltransferase involved in cell wall biosynthesis